MDYELQIARKEQKEAPDDPNAKYRWRIACVRAGVPEEAGFEVGDIVSLTQKCVLAKERLWRNCKGRIMGSNDGNLYFIRSFLEYSNPPEQAEIYECTPLYSDEIRLLEPQPR